MRSLKNPGTSQGPSLGSGGWAPTRPRRHPFSSGDSPRLLAVAHQGCGPRSIFENVFSCIQDGISRSAEGGCSRGGRLEPHPARVFLASPLRTEAEQVSPVSAPTLSPSCKLLLLSGPLRAPGMTSDARSDPLSFQISWCKDSSTTFRLTSRGLSNSRNPRAQHSHGWQRPLLREQGSASPLLS